MFMNQDIPRSCLGSLEVTLQNRNIFLNQIIFWKGINHILSRGFKTSIVS